MDYNYKRNSVRITSNEYYDVGSVWVLDATHLPYGCSVSYIPDDYLHRLRLVLNMDVSQVWPGFWSTGDNWPKNGESKLGFWSVSIFASSRANSCVL